MYNFWNLKVYSSCAF